VPTNPIRPTQATATQPADLLTPPNAKKPVADETACPAMPRDQLIQGGTAATPVGDYRAAIESLAAGTWGAAQRAESTVAGVADKLGQLGSKVAGAATDAAGVGLGAGGLVLTTQSSAGNAGEDAPSAAWRQHSNAVADRMPQQTHTTYPGQRVDVGPSHTAHPASPPHSAKDNVHTTPMESSTKAPHTGHSVPDLGELTKPTGTMIHPPDASDLMTEKTRPLHAGVPANTAPSTAYRPQAPYAEFDTFDALKDYLGSAGEGRDWHHIVGQHEANVAKFGPRAIHNTDNVVSIDRNTVHRPLSADYSRKPKRLDGQTVREHIAQKPYEEQRAFDLHQLDRFGVTIK